MAKAPRGYPDLHDHLAALDRAGLLVTVDRAIDKDSELHPLVRWQFRGGIKESERKAFLFRNVVDAKGRHYDIPVVVGAIAASRAGRAKIEGPLIAPAPGNPPARTTPPRAGSG